MTSSFYDTEGPLPDGMSAEQYDDEMNAAHDEAWDQVYAEHQAPRVFEIPAHNLPEFTKRVDKANRRLERAGGTERFEFTYEHFEKDDLTLNGITGEWEPTGTHSPWVRASLVNEKFRIQAGDHTFVATLIAEEAGYTVHTAPGQSLEGWTRPPVDDIHCDVCHTVRRRINLYIVRNNQTGELLQVGSNCIAPLLGFSPKSLWALTWTDDLVDLTEEHEERAGYGARAERTVDIDRILSVAWILTNEGRKYTSVKIAEEREITSTSSQVRGHIFNPPNAYWKRAEREAYYRDDERMREAQDNEELMAALKASVYTGTHEGTDYGDNLRTILASESGRVTYRNIGILASVVAIYAREQDLFEQRKANPPAEGYLAEAGTRLRNLTLTVKTARQFERDSFGYRGGTDIFTMVIASTPDNHIVKWVRSGAFNHKAGEVIKLEAATVKECTPYKGTDQTVIFRAKIDDFEERAQKCAELIAEKGETWTEKRNTGRYNKIALTEGWQVPEGIAAYSVHRGNPAAADQYSKGYSTEEFPFGYYTEPVFEEVTDHAVDRWFNSKAEKKRFAQWFADYLVAEQDVEADKSAEGISL